MKSSRSSFFIYLSTCRWSIWVMWSTSARTLIRRSIVIYLQKKLCVIMMATICAHETLETIGKNCLRSPTKAISLAYAGEGWAANLRISSWCCEMNEMSCEQGWQRAERAKTTPSSPLAGNWDTCSLCEPSRASQGWPPLGSFGSWARATFC